MRFRPAADHALAALLAAVGIERGEAGQGGDGLGGALAKFGGQGEQGCGGDRTDTRDGAQPPFGLGQVARDRSYSGADHRTRWLDSSPVESGTAWD